MKINLQGGPHSGRKVTAKSMEEFIWIRASDNKVFRRGDSISKDKYHVYHQVDNSNTLYYRGLLLLPIDYNEDEDYWK